MQLGSRGVWTMLCRSDHRDCVPPTPRCRKKICNLEFFLFEKLIHLVGVFCFPLYMESIFDMASDTNSTCEKQAWNNKTLNHTKNYSFVGDNVRVAILRLNLIVEYSTIKSTVFLIKVDGEVVKVDLGSREVIMGFVHAIVTLYSDCLIAILSATLARDLT